VLFAEFRLPLRRATVEAPLSLGPATSLATLYVVPSLRVQAFAGRRFRPGFPEVSALAGWRQALPLTTVHPTRRSTGIPGQRSLVGA